MEAELTMTRRTCRKGLEDDRKILEHTVIRRLNAPDCELVLLHLRMNETGLSLKTSGIYLSKDVPQALEPVESPQMEDKKHSELGHGKRTPYIVHDAHVR